MPLWGKTDTLASAPKYLSADAAAPMQNDRDNAFFVDTTEAAVTSNREKGLKTAGWNLYKEYGTGRKYVETLVPMKVTAAAAGDVGITNDTATEDLTLLDTILAITAQPVGITVDALATATFTVTATATPDTTITYQWQKQESYQSGATWNDVATGTGGTTNQYTTAATVSGVQNSPGTDASTGDKYRVIISAPGKTAQTITSNVVTLTVTPTP
jgi:hypothetical protein